MDVFDNVNGFEWDKHNALKIFEKHTVTIGEAEDIFADKKALISEARNSGTEIRFAIMGKSNKKNLIAVFTIRNNKIRIISARPQSKQERKLYVKKTK